jgi:AraC-like DNA-binding protein
MLLRTSQPSALLSGVVRKFWAMEACSKQLHTQRIVPTGTTELIFYLAEKPSLKGSANDFKGTAYYHGPTDAYFDLEVKGNMNIFAITFQPQGAFWLLPQPMDDLFRQLLPLEFLFPKTASEWEDRIAHSRTFEEKVKISEEAIIRLITKDTIGHHEKRVARILHMIHPEPGKWSIDQLASEAYLCRKQFERTFNEQLGLTPKRFLRIIRFQRAIFEKQMNPKLSLAALAYQCHYADQSHMIRDFQLISGLSPGEYFGLCDPVSDYYSV